MNSAAGVIDELIGASLPQEVKDMTALLGKLRTEYNGTVKDIASGMATLQKSTGVKSVSASVDGITTSTRKIVDLQTEIEKVTQKIVQMSGEEAKSLAELKLKLSEITAANKEYAKSQAAPTGSIDAMKLKLKDLETQINRVADAEGKGADQVKKLEAEYNKLDATVRKHQQNIGNFSKSVGNYEKGFNGMSLAISQIAREMPNFAQSVQNGIMSLTNNIGGLTDAYKELVMQNKALQAAGQPTVSVFGSIARAVFSWNTLIMISVTALTALAPKIQQLISGTKESEKAQKDLNEARREGVKAAGAEISKLELLYKASTDANIPQKERAATIHKIQEMYPGYFDNMDEEAFLAGKAAMKYTELKDAILASARAKAIRSKLELRASDRLDTEEAVQQQIDKLHTQLMGYYDQGQTDIFVGAGNQRRRLTVAEAQRLYDLTVAKLRAELNAAKEEWKRNDAFLEDELKKMEEKSKALEDSRTKALASGLAEREKKEEDAANKRDQREKARLERELKQKLEELKELHDRIDKYLKIDQNSRIDADEDLRRYVDYWEKAKEKMRAELDRIFGGKDDRTSDVTNIMDSLVMPTLDTQGAADLSNQLMNRKSVSQTDKEENKKLSAIRRELSALITTAKQLQSAIDSIINQLAQNINRQADKAISTVDLIEKKELDALDRKQLTFKQHEEEKKRIELAAEARRQKIEHEKIKDLRRMAMHQKAISINMIIAETALAVMSALHDKSIPTYYLRVAAAIAAGAAGAAQLASVIATPLPQYADGRDDGPAEFAVVNERGPEVIENPDGKMWVANKGKKGITFLPENAKVHPYERIKNAAFIQLARTNGPVTEDSYAEAIINAYMEGTDRLEKAIKSQSTNWNIYADAGFAIRYKQRIRR